MALTYRNTITGAVVDMPEPSELLASAQARAEELMRVGTRKAREEAEAIESNAKWQRIWLTQNLARMDECDKWERCTRPVESPVKAEVDEQRLAALKAEAEALGVKLHHSMKAETIERKVAESRAAAEQ